MSENPSKTKVEINPKLKVVIERMTKHPEDSFPLSAMARESALSEVMFTSAFKRATGLTPHAYLLDIRIKHARAKIIAGEKSITQIALRYGFKTARHFSAVFKRITGQTPSQCRDSAKRHNIHNKQLKSRQQLKSLEFTHFFSYRRSMQCLPRICGQYRPNRTPGTKSGVGACVRPRPLAAPLGLSLRLRAT